jgi:hypothetical protein
MSQQRMKAHVLAIDPIRHGDSANAMGDAVSARPNRARASVRR